MEGSLRAGGSKGRLMALPRTNLERLLGSVPDAVVGVDEAGVIGLVNRLPESLFGHVRDDLLGAPVEMLVPGNARAGHPGHWKQFAASRRTRHMGAQPTLSGRRADGSEFPAGNGMPVIAPLIPDGRTEEINTILAKLMTGQSIDRLQTTRRRKDGTVFLVSLTVSPIRDDRGRITGLSTITSDETMQRRSIEVAQRMAAIVENSDEAVLSSTLDGIVTSWNPASEQIYGCISAEIIGRSLQPLPPPDRAQEVTDILTRIETGQRVEASIPVSALSALAMKADEERSQRAGCDAYIVKPLRYKELYAVMERLLAELRPADKQEAPPSRSPT